MHGPEADATQSVSKSLRKRLDKWRKEHGGRGRRIPEELWADAAEVASVEGVEITARRLRLSRDRLEERVAKKTGCRPKGRSDDERPEFIELALPHSRSTGRTMFMLANGRGDELCIIDMAGCVDIRTLVRDFWDRR
jgi:hypothetical protein